MAKIIRLRLEDKDSGEFRNVAVGAVSADEAAAIVEEQERKRASFVLSPEEAVGLEKRLKDGSLSSRDKARLFTHHQSEPYKVMKAKEA